LTDNIGRYSLEYIGFTQYYNLPKGLRVWSFMWKRELRTIIHSNQTSVSGI